ncbi:type II toxin-antitoxin system HicB family antitoxin [Mariprofundus ferrooxydans]|nr:type II toxin-antitoxin system HicB family antitoxin [Mariprofundus ferrooxydans]
MYAYPVTLEQDGDSILVTFPDIPEAITFGEDKGAALLQAQDALETALELYVDARRPLPSASVGELSIAPTLLVQAKLRLYEAMLAQNIRKSELARRLGWHMPQVDRILALDHISKMPQIEQAASALDVHMEIT